MVSIEERDSGGKISFGFMQGESIKIMSKLMNFTPKYILPDDGFLYGFQKSDGSFAGSICHFNHNEKTFIFIFTGSLAAIEYDRADLTAGSHYITNYNTTKTQFLYPIFSTQQYFVIPRFCREEIHDMIFFYLFDEHSKCLIISMLIIFPILVYVVKKLEAKIFHDKTVLLENELLYVAAISSNISVKHGTHDALRILVFTLLFLTLIDSSLFQGHIVQKLNIHKDNSGMDSLQELLESGLELKMPYALFPVFKEADGNKFTEVMQALAKNMSKHEIIPMEDELGFQNLIENRSSAYLLSSLYLECYIKQFYDNETGEDLLTYVLESPFEFYKSLLAPKASPFTDAFNKVLLEIIESGVLQHQVNLAFFENEKHIAQRTKLGQFPKIKEKQFNMKQMYATFRLYLMLNALSVCVFGIELAVSYLKGKNFL